MTTAFDFDAMTTSRLADMVSDLETMPSTGDAESDAFYGEALTAARAELKKRNTRTYRIIIDFEGNTDDYVNDYFFEGTKAEFAAAYGLTGKHNPHRATGTVELSNGYIMRWGVQG